METETREEGGEKNKEKGMKKLSVKEERRKNFFSSTFSGTWCLRLKKVSAIRGDFVLGFWGLIRFVGGSCLGDFRRQVLNLTYWVFL